jgi:hypothetical protein
LVEVEIRVTDASRPDTIGDVVDIVSSSAAFIKGYWLPIVAVIRGAATVVRLEIKD